MYVRFHSVAVLDLYLSRVNVSKLVHGKGHIGHRPLLELHGVVPGCVPHIQESAHDGPKVL